MKRVFVSDCEGPLSKNDNAFELAENFVPNGDKFFANISKYDDVLSEVNHKQGYSAGSTLKLILPFFKAYGITDSQIEEFSSKNIMLIPNSRATFRYIQRIAHTFIVSTSYHHYIKALCKAIDFSYKNTYCTKVSLDKFPITLKEKECLRKIAQEIAEMTLINIPQAAKEIADFSRNDQETIGRLNEIFWSEIPNMFVGRILNDVVTVGGEQKAEAIHDATKRVGAKIEDVLYVGDSITDVEAFKLVSTNGGLTISFNGNGYAIKNAEVAVLSESNIVTAMIADLFVNLGKEQTLRVLSSQNHGIFQKKIGDETLRNEFFKIYHKRLPKVQIVTTENMQSLINESIAFSNNVRALTIGRLG